VTRRRVKIEEEERRRKKKAAAGLPSAENYRRENDGFCKLISFLPANSKTKKIPPLPPAF